MTNEKAIETLTQLCQEAFEALEECDDTINKLKEHNQFLTDTIVNNNLGKITAERRRLLNENRALKKEIILLTGKIKQLRS